MQTHDLYQTAVYVGLLGVWTVSVSPAAVPDEPTIYRPETATGPAAYRPGSAAGPAAYRPLSTALPPFYRPNNPTLPSG